MWRLFDWVCLECASEHEEPVEMPQGTEPMEHAPEFEQLDCLVCGCVRPHKRAKIHLIRQYLGDRPEAPMIKGGEFDTEGYKRLPSLPEFRGDTASDFRDFANTKDYKEAKKARGMKKKENKAKQARAKIIRSGANIDVRHHPLPGDPKF